MSSANKEEKRLQKGKGFLMLGALAFVLAFVAPYSPITALGLVIFFLANAVRVTTICPQLFLRGNGIKTRTDVELRVRKWTNDKPSVHRVSSWTVLPGCTVMSPAIKSITWTLFGEREYEWTVFWKDDQTEWTQLATGKSSLLQDEIVLTL